MGKAPVDKFRAQIPEEGMVFNVKRKITGDLT